MRKKSWKKNSQGKLLIKLKLLQKMVQKVQLEHLVKEAKMKRNCWIASKR